MNKKKEMCADIAKQGMYYPILRIKGDKASLDAIACSKDCFGSSARGSPLKDTNSDGKGELATFFVLFLSAFIVLS
jgi:hypothetical protein